MPKPIKINVENESIYVAKSNFFGWGVVRPIKNEDNSINWKNLLIGGKWLNIIIIIFLVIIILGFTSEYRTNAKKYHDLLFLCNNTLENLDPNILNNPGLLNGYDKIVIINKSTSCKPDLIVFSNFSYGGESNGNSSSLLSDSSTII